MSSIFDWSTSAQNNANSDNLINWAEGQPPSTVNNSARAMMQRVREVLCDMGGDTVVQGNDPYIDILTKSPMGWYPNGLVLRFRANYTNNGAIWLNANWLGSKPVFKATQSGITGLTWGNIQAAGIYEVVYNTALDNGAGGWLLLNPTPVYKQAVPAGVISLHGSTKAPEGYLICNGWWYKKWEHPALFDAIGYTWGGDWNTNFAVPDLRGAFPRGWDDGRGLDSGRNFASFQWSENLAHTHYGETSWNGEHHHDYWKPNYLGPGADGEDGWKYYEPVLDTTSTAWNHNHTFTTWHSGGNESRPVNVAVTYIIKT